MKTTNNIPCKEVKSIALQHHAMVGCLNAFSCTYAHLNQRFTIYDDDNNTTNCTTAATAFAFTILLWMLMMTSMR